MDTPFDRGIPTRNRFNLDCVSGRPAARSRVKATVSGPPGVDLVKVVAGSGVEPTRAEKTKTPGALEGIVFPRSGSNSDVFP
jgi:hypothetical protein